MGEWGMSLYTKQCLGSESSDLPWTRTGKFVEFMYWASQYNSDEKFEFDYLKIISPNTIITYWLPESSVYRLCTAINPI